MRCNFKIIITKISPQRVRCYTFSVVLMALFQVVVACWCTGITDGWSWTSAWQHRQRLSDSSSSSTARAANKSLRWYCQPGSYTAFAADFHHCYCLLSIETLLPYRLEISAACVYYTNILFYVPVNLYHKLNGMARIQLLSMLIICFENSSAHDWLEINFSDSRQYLLVVSNLPLNLQPYYLSYGYSI